MTLTTDNTTGPHEMRIAILGGGIGGLAAAAFLNRAGLQATVYEQAPELGEVGAGLVVSPNAVRLIRRLGHIDTFLDKAVPLEVGWEFRRWDNGKVLSAEQLTGRCEELYGERTYVAHRADLLEAVKAAVPEQWLRLGKRCVKVNPHDGGAVLSFDDGTTADADIVIGADGVHSVVRSVVATPGPAEYSGMCAFRAIVPAEAAPEFARRKAQTLWIGPDHHLVHYPISGGRAVNIVAFAPAGDFTDESWSTKATVDELLAEFDGWDPRLTELIKAAGTPGRWALLDRAPLTRWSRGRLTLLGDAAHPMFPFFAQGAAQAIEDGAALAQCLADDLGNPERALETYERVRIERTTKIQQLSHARKDINHLPDGPAQLKRDAGLAEGDPLLRNGWLYGHDAELAVKEAMV
ncbi:FAD-dependent monooxygenase [Arthrobacter sp. Marseille-P9274]|uniref:FAD-dependent monooxygenase n=1 Tax=Arthrobacter sp. Marseille-P9274 TaxID=2866572 RepID=UPI0021C78FCC|nr:FAD-dependent monooxygenase [Arthrobacter sp. Marseille-P9274]